MQTFNTITVIGAGAWGTALANAAALAGRQVQLWTRNSEAIAAMIATRQTPKLPGVLLHDAVTPTASLEKATEAEALILASPTQALRDIAALLQGILPPHRPVIATSKGIERRTGFFVTDILRELLPFSLPAILSGPGFAVDVAAGRPTAVALASSDASLGEALARSLGSKTFRIYHTTDMRGVEIGGATKNVLAIAAGIAAGRALGDSAVGSLLTRAFAELVRFGEAYGGMPETLAGLSGLGDLISTGTSSLSRNRRFGEALGQGLSIAEATNAVGLAEGVWTAPILVDMARERGIDMPIAATVAELVAGRTTVEEAVEALLSRPPRSETGSFRSF